MELYSLTQLNFTDYVTLAIWFTYLTTIVESGIPFLTRFASVVQWSLLTVSTPGQGQVRGPNRKTPTMSPPITKMRTRHRSDTAISCRLWSHLRRLLLVKRPALNRISFGHRTRNPNTLAPYTRMPSECESSCRQIVSWTSRAGRRIAVIQRRQLMDNCVLVKGEHGLLRLCTAFVTGNSHFFLNTFFPSQNRGSYHIRDLRSIRTTT